MAKRRLTKLEKKEQRKQNYKRQFLEMHRNEQRKKLLAISENEKLIDKTLNTKKETSKSFKRISIRRRELKYNSNLSISFLTNKKSYVTFIKKDFTPKFKIIKCVQRGSVVTFQMEEKY
ncbi:MAG: hypothetical protein NXI00_01735 [Cytophagales bacterium]|nr:hypothetical protein [Cytophagales bacterium]